MQDTTYTGQELYVPPTLRPLGSVHELTLSHARWHRPGACSPFNKTLGPPDYWTFIPIANCSA